MNSTSITNLALGRIGHTRITSITEGSKAGGAALDAYEPLLRAILADHDWNFAISRVPLAQAPTPVSGYGFAYFKPADCLKPLEVNDEPREDWQEENDTLVFDYATATLKYIRYEDNPDKWSAGFLMAFYHLLASHLAGSLLADSKKSDELLNQYLTVLLPQAKAIDGSTGRAKVMRSTTLTSDIRQD